MTTSTYTQKKPSFYTVSAPAGTGKTTSAIQYAADQVIRSKKLFIFAVPSIKKANEVYIEFEKRNVSETGYYFDKPFNLKVVTSKSEDGSIENAIAKTMNAFHQERLETGKGGIIIVTHQGFLISNEIGKQDAKPFHLIWDETTTVAYLIEGKIMSEMKVALFDNVLDVIHNEENDTFTGEVKESAIPHLKERMKNKGIGYRDSEELKTINRHLLNSGEGFCDILLGGNIENQVTMMFLYNPLRFYGYQSVTFMGANLEMTMLYRWFSKMNVEWEPHQEIAQGIDFVPGEVHNFRLNIYYGNKGRKHTRSFLDKMNVENKTYRQLFTERALEMIGSGTALLLKNKKDEYDYPLNLIECPYNMEGLNEFKDHNTALLTGSFNQESPYYALLKKLGLEDCSEPLRLYQYLMRMACREWDYRGTCDLYIPCLSLFEEIKHLFNPIMISYIPMGLEFEEAEDGRKNLVVPTSEWYEITSYPMMIKQYDFPKRNTKGEYVEWFKMFGYQSTSIEVKSRDKSRPNAMKKHLVVYKTESGLEMAKKHFE